MRSSFFRAAAVGIGMLLAGTSLIPAQAAMPIPNPGVSTSSDIQTVRDNKRPLWRHQGHKHRSGKHTRSRTHVRAHRSHHGWRGHTVRHGYHYWHGHRGYRSYRPGYRRYNGWWFPPAAFSLGIIVGGHATGSRHVRWCYNHYRSYRASDNTYQPYNGPRRQCVSP